MIYLFMFVTSLLIAWLSYKFPQKSLTRRILTIIAIIIPCIMAAMRSCNVGTDVKVYAEKWYLMAVHEKSFFTFFESINSPDILYALLTFITARANNIGVLFFIAQLATITPVAYLAFKSKNAKTCILTLVLYYLFFYNISLNLMRQSISLSMSLLSFYFLSRKAKKKYVIFTIIAILFHFSGILGLAYPIIISAKTRRSKIAVISISSMAVFFGIIFFSDILHILNIIGILPERFLSYSTIFLREKIQIDFVREAYFAIITIVAMIIRKNDNNIKSLAILGLLVFQIGIVSNFAYRASYVFYYPVLFIHIPTILQDKKATKQSALIVAILIGAMTLYWYQQIVLLRVHETYPYTLRLVTARQKESMEA